VSCNLGLSGAEVEFDNPTVDPIYEEAPELLASSQRALDGTLQTCYVTYKMRWGLTWALLSTAEKNALLAELRRASDLSWEPPTGGSYTVHVVPSPQATLDALGWTVRAELVEV
jgi:hypothetical protein